MWPLRRQTTSSASATSHDKESTNCQRMDQGLHVYPATYPLPANFQPPVRIVPSGGGGNGGRVRQAIRAYIERPLRWPRFCWRSISCFRLCASLFRRSSATSLAIRACSADWALSRPIRACSATRSFCSAAGTRSPSTLAILIRMFCSSSSMASGPTPRARRWATRSCFGMSFLSASPSSLVYRLGSFIPPLHQSPRWTGLTTFQQAGREGGWTFTEGASGDCDLAGNDLEMLESAQQIERAMDRETYAAYAGRTLSSARS